MFRLQKSAIALILLLSVSVLKGESSLKIGVARLNITPDCPVTLAGYANRTALSEGIHDSLFVRVTAFEQDQSKCILVSTDIIGFYAGTADIIRNEILSQYQLNPSELFLSAIHTHAAPSVSLNQKKAHPNNVAYTQFLQKQIVRAVGLALEKMKPAQICMGTGASPIGVNRREVFYDENHVPKTWIGRNPNGVHDRSVQVVGILQNDKLTGLLFDYACHSTSLGWDNYLISGDIHGIAENFIESFMKQEVIAAGFAGASGDIDPWYRVLPGFETENGWIPEPVLMGTMLGQEVIHMIRRMDQTDVGGSVDTRFITLGLPGKPKGDYEKSEKSDEVDFNITVARVGQIALVGLGGEVLTEIGLSIKSASPFSQTMVITHCNGTAGYLPPRQLYVEGGYEVETSPFSAAAADQVIARAVELLYELKRSI